MKRAAAIMLAIFLAGMLGLFLLRTAPVNDWEMKNAPAGRGPVVCFGDSLVAGVGAETEQDRYPNQLARLLKRDVISCGTKGQTASEGLRQLRQHPEITAPVVIVTLGGNDILRQVPLEKTTSALSEIFTVLQQRGALVVFTGVEGLISGTRGERYRELCRENGVVYVPDVLGGILSDESLKSDQVHPNGAGYREMAERVAAVLSPFLTETDT